MVPRHELAYYEIFPVCTQLYREIRLEIWFSEISAVNLIVGWPQFFKRWITLSTAEINHYPVDNAIVFPNNYPLLALSSIWTTVAWWSSAFTEIYPQNNRVENIVLFLVTANQRSERWTFTIVKNYRSRRLIGRRMFFGYKNRTNSPAMR